VQDFIEIEEYKIKSDLVESIMENPDHMEILFQFEGEIQKFINECEEFISMTKNIFNENHIKMQNENECSHDKINEIKEKNKIIKNIIDNDSVDQGKTGLINYIYEYIKTKGNLFNDEKFHLKFINNNNRIIIDYVVEDYINREHSYLEIVKEKYFENLKKTKNKLSIDNKNFNTEKQTKITIDYKNILLKSIEAFFVILLIYLSYLSVNQETVSIKKMSLFNKKALLTFDEYKDCNDSFLKILTSSDMNKWIHGCYLIT